MVSHYLLVLSEFSVMSVEFIVMVYPFTFAVPARASIRNEKVTTCTQISRHDLCFSTA